jgi:hypothetical protein
LFALYPVPVPLQATANKATAERAAELAAKDRKAAEENVERVKQAQAAAEQRAKEQDGE